MFKVFALGFALTLSLSGCGTVKYVDKPVFTKVPKSLTSFCQKSAPPAKDSYLSLTDEQKVTILESLVVDLYQDIDVCNAKLSSVDSWSETQSKSIANTPLGE